MRLFAAKAWNETVSRRGNGMVISLDEVPDALEQVRKAQGPPRIVVHVQNDPIRRQVI